VIDLRSGAGRAAVHGEQELRLAQLAKHHGPAARVRRGDSLRPSEMEQGGFKFTLDALGGGVHGGGWGKKTVKPDGKFFDMPTIYRYYPYLCNRFP
jgi:hypothetical protein